MSEKDRMLMGLEYDPADSQLVQERYKANKICMKYNQSALNEINMNSRLLKKLIKTAGDFVIKPPFYCDYGYNIYLDDGVMLNYGCVLLDVCSIDIGKKTVIGPYTQIYTACHPIDPNDRLDGIEYGKPVVIGENVWIGGNVTILPGVTIGKNSVIGAGSVVTKDIPENVVAAGNPCRIIRKID